MRPLLCLSFNNEVIGNIKEKLGEKLPTKITKEVLISAIPAENNYLVRIGHRINSSGTVLLFSYRVTGQDLKLLSELDKQMR